jgi:hypothetical protein
MSTRTFPNHEYDNEYDSFESMSEQVKHRYKEGDLILVRDLLSPLVDIRVVDQEGEWVVKTENIHYSKVDNELIVLRVYLDGMSAYIRDAFSNSDYMFPYEPAMLFSKTRTAKLRLRIKPAKVERREEEEEV